MDYLWTPWRYQYLVAPEKPDGCIFCLAAADKNDHHHLVVHRAIHNFVILNRYPYTNGHLMIVPYRHVSTMLDLDEATLSELMLLARAAEGHLRSIYHPDGLNFGINIGKSAGAGIAGHLHMHALPRWTGDSNFMTVIGETRVLPEELEVTWRRVSEAFREAAVSPHP
jgi:ATP adenylyltransferase